MKTFYRFTEDDILNLTTAREALQRIDCELVPCNICPLYLGNRCITNRLTNLIADAENKRGV